MSFAETLSGALPLSQKLVLHLISLEHMGERVGLIGKSVLLGLGVMKVLVLGATKMEGWGERGQCNLP